MNVVDQACALAADIDAALQHSTLEQCERLKRCISSIIPLLATLQGMKNPLKSATIKAIHHLHKALDTVHGMLKNCEPNQACQQMTQMTVLRQLWQRQIELHLALQFQTVFEQDLDRTLCKTSVWGQVSPRTVEGSGYVDF